MSRSSSEKRVANPVVTPPRCCISSIFVRVFGASSEAGSELDALATTSKTGASLLSQSIKKSSMLAGSSLAPEAIIAATVARLRRIALFRRQTVAHHAHIVRNKAICVALATVAAIIASGANHDPANIDDSLIDCESKLAPVFNVVAKASSSDPASLAPRPSQKLRKYNIAAE